jgi:hypothetical protein
VPFHRSVEVEPAAWIEGLDAPGTVGQPVAWIEGMRFEGMRFEGPSAEP